MPRNAKESAALRRSLEHLEASGLLLVSDATLPSVASLVAEAPLRGSWWAHPQAHAIFCVAEQVGEHPDVLTVKLISGKATYVHKKLWPALFAVATSGEDWQVKGLSPQAEELLALVRRRGTVRLDQLAASRAAAEKVLGNAARELETRLLVLSESVHTERGSHTKQLESWVHAARRLRLTGRKMAVETAKKKFDEIAADLKARFRKPLRLPWRKM